MISFHVNGRSHILVRRKLCTVQSKICYSFPIAFHVYVISVIIDVLIMLLRIVVKIDLSVEPRQCANQ